LARCFLGRAHGQEASGYRPEPLPPDRHLRCAYSASMTKTTISLVIDTDTASDDAVAIMLACRAPHVTIRAVTTVAGNVPITMATRNALVTLELCAVDAPVHVGAARPLVRALETAQNVHGEDGMSGVAFEDPTMVIESTTAPEALVRIARDEPGQHTLVTLGPLTNVAAALLIEPGLLAAFTSVVIMGGAFDGVGNMNRCGEFNIWADPEAAAVVVDAPGQKLFVGWDMSRRHGVISDAEAANLRRQGPVGEFVVDINRCVGEFARAETGLDGFDLPDPLAMAIAIDRTVATGVRPANIVIGIDDVCRGAAIIDRRPDAVADPPNAEIVTIADEDRFKSMLMEACSPR